RPSCRSTISSSVTSSRLTMPAVTPRGDAADDEEPLARADAAEPAPLPDQLRLGVREGDLALEPHRLLAQRPDLRLRRLQGVFRVQVRLRRLPVEERDEHEGAEREQSGRAEPEHAPVFGGGPLRPPR